MDTLGVWYAGAGCGASNTMGVLEALDVQAAVAYTSSQPSVDPERIVVFGTSFGRATAILAAAAHETIAGGIALAPFSSVSFSSSASLMWSTGSPMARRRWMASRPHTPCTSLPTATFARRRRKALPIVFSLAVRPPRRISSPAGT